VGAGGTQQQAEPRDGAVDVAAGCDEGVALGTITGLGLTATSNVQTINQTIPADPTTDADWGPKAAACQQGGYALTALAGGTVCLLSEDVTQSCQGYPAAVWVVMSRGAVACVYKALQPGSLLAPGIYSATNPLCHD
jgi:hypothetical protein